MSTEKKKRMLYEEESLKVHNLHPYKRRGPSNLLLPNEEAKLREWIVVSSNRGHTVTRGQLLNSVRLMVKIMSIPNCISYNGPSSTWYEAFRRRHKDLKIKNHENLTGSAISEDSLKNWFSTVQAYLSKTGLLNIDASRIFYTFETTLPLNLKSSKSLALPCINNTDASKIKSITTLITGNASGQLAPSLLIFPYKKIPDDFYKKIPDGWRYDISDSGCITSENFYEYIVHVFEPWIKEQKINLPVILYINGHVPYLTQPLAQFCQEKQIQLIALYPMSVLVRLSMEQLLFSPLMTTWRAHVNDYRQETMELSVKESDAASVLKNVFNKMDLSNTLKQVFETCGLHPFPSEAIDFFKVFKQLTTEKSPS